MRELYELTAHDPKDTWLVYSDNVYAYDAETDTLHSLDGVKMEAQV